MVQLKNKQYPPIASLSLTVNHTNKRKLHTKAPTRVCSRELCNTAPSLFAIKSTKNSQPHRNFLLHFVRTHTHTITLTESRFPHVSENYHHNEEGKGGGGGRMDLSTPPSNFVFPQNINLAPSFSKLSRNSRSLSRRVFFPPFACTIFPNKFFPLEVI